MCYLWSDFRAWKVPLREAYVLKFSLLVGLSQLKLHRNLGAGQVIFEDLALVHVSGKFELHGHVQAAMMI